MLPETFARWNQLLSGGGWPRADGENRWPDDTENWEAWRKNPCGAPSVGCWCCWAPRWSGPCWSGPGIITLH